MVTFQEANQARLVVKMKLSNYSWYVSSLVVSENDGYSVIVGVKTISNYIRKIVPPIVNGVSVRMETE